jgi:hypothetical protein
MTTKIPKGYEKEYGKLLKEAAKNTTIQARAESMAQRRLEEQIQRQSDKKKK